MKIICLFMVGVVANVLVSSAQSPDISYNANYTFIVGMQITKVSPSNTGGGIPNIAYGTTVTMAGGMRGYEDGVGTNAKFDTPQGICVDEAGNIYVADRYNHRIRKIMSDGTTSTIAGIGTAGFLNGNAITTACLNQPSDVAVDASGIIYVTELGNHAIRKIINGQVTTLCGSGGSGYNDATGSSAEFNTPFGIIAGRDGYIYATDRYNHRIRKITSSGLVSTYAGSGSTTGINAQGIKATFSNPTGIALDSNGVLYIGDYANHLIRAIDGQQNVSTLAGCFCGGRCDGKGLEAGFRNPFGLAVGPTGDIFVADYNNHLIRRITPEGVVTTLAGSGVAGNVNGVAEGAAFRNPSDVAVDKMGNVFIADTGNRMIRKVCSTGYRITPNLPEGLLFNTATGEITGTPVVVSAGQFYTVIAYNQSGSSTSSFALEIISSASNINTTQEEILFSVFPNPLQENRFFIYLMNDEKQLLDITIYDASGQVLQRGTYANQERVLEVKTKFHLCNTVVFVEVAGLGVAKLVIN